MLTIFNTLRSVYASREITMDDFKVLQQYDFIHFENKGISRSKHDCLLCEVHCKPFVTFLQDIKNSAFDSPEMLRRFIVNAKLGLIEEISSDDTVFSFQSEDKKIEVIAVLEDGKISIEEIEDLPYFQVFLRVQH